MNELMNPIKNLFRKKVVPPPKHDESSVFYESRTIPSEYSNQSPLSPAKNDDGEDDDYYVYKLDPYEDNKWPSWNLNDQKPNPLDNRFDIHISDTEKNSCIHIFPGKQNLISPHIGSTYQFQQDKVPHNFFTDNFYEKSNLPNQSSNPKNDKLYQSRILPPSILEDSVRPEQPQPYQTNRINEFPGINKNLLSPEFGPQIISAGGARSLALEDYSRIMELKKKDPAVNLDESDDMSFAQVIKTLEKNISNSKANRLKRLKNQAQKMEEFKLIHNGKNQEDTLSLDQSSAMSSASMMRNMLIPQEQKDLRAQFLAAPAEENKTVFYSFASADNRQDSMVIHEGRDSNFPGNLILNDIRISSDKSPFENHNDHFTFGTNPPTATFKIEPKRIDGNFEQYYSDIKNHNEPTHQYSNSKTQIISHTRASSHQYTPSVASINNKTSSTKQKFFHSRGPSLTPKDHASENFILCMNCNDLIPVDNVDKHSKYCNENMLAQDELSDTLIIEPENLSQSLEKCNKKLIQLKDLLAKNYANIKRQSNLGIVSVPQSDVLFSEIELALYIVEELIKIKGVSPKLQIDSTSLLKLKEEFANYVDVTLLNIMVSNLEVVLEICYQKRIVLELLQKQESHFSTENEISHNPTYHGQKPSLPTNSSQSTRGGSSIHSRRVPVGNRFPFGN